MFRTKKSKVGVVVTLKDVKKIVTAWRKSCEERGQFPVGVYSFMSVDQKCEYAHEGLRWIFGDAETLLPLHRENTQALLANITKNSGGKKMKKGDGIVFHL